MNYSFPMRLWEINLSKNDGTPIAFDKLWAFSALLKEVNTMNCPYCNNEMEKGLIQSPQELNWIKGEKRKFFTRAFLHKDSIVLSELSMMKGSACVAYNCSNCKKIVIDYADGSNDLNGGTV